MIETPAPQQRPLSVRIGRVVVRLILLGLVAWGGWYGYRTWQAKKLAEEIAPVHRFAEQYHHLMKNGDYFRAQGMLSPEDQHKLSVDWLAHFAQLAEVNATADAITWGEWNRTGDIPRSYYLQGTVHYRTGRTLPLEALIEKNETVSVLKKWKIGKHALHPKIPPEL